MWRQRELFHFVVSGHPNVDPFTLNLKKSHCPRKMATFFKKHPLLDGGGVVKCQGWLGIQPRVLHCGWQHSALIYTRDRKKDKETKQNKNNIEIKSRIDPQRESE